MVDHVDLRVRRTYRLLTSALLDMLEERSFNDITVRALCDRAMVRPATFYTHFGDKNELFVFLVQELQQQFRENNPYKSSSDNPQNYYIWIINQTLRFLECNKPLVTNVVNSSALGLLVDLLSEQIESQVRNEFIEDAERGVQLPSDPEVMAPLFTGALVYLAKWWILSGWSMNREELLRSAAQAVGIEI